MDMISRQAKLISMAEADPGYTAWKKAYEDSVIAFEAYAGEQDEQVQNLLWGYATGGRLMYQRLVNLACKYMQFPGET